MLSIYHRHMLILSSWYWFEGWKPWIGHTTWLAKSKSSVLYLNTFHKDCHKVTLLLNNVKFEWIDIFDQSQNNLWSATSTPSCILCMVPKMYDFWTSLKKTYFNINTALHNRSPVHLTALKVNLCRLCNVKPVRS